LRDVTDNDLPIFFEQQLDQEANNMAAFTSRDPAHKEAFMKHWAIILSDRNVKVKTIAVSPATVADHWRTTPIQNLASQRSRTGLEGNIGERALQRKLLQNF
jgi:hypothetical protein